MLAWQERRIDGARRDVPGRPAVRDARLDLRHRYRGRRPARATRLDPRGPRLRDGPADARRTSRRSRCPTASRSARSAPEDAAARLGRLRRGVPRRARRRRVVRGRTGSATSPTRTGTRRSGPSPSSATRSPAASTAASTPRRTPTTASSRGYIAGVWTRRPYRRRGLARALLARVLVLLRERGMTSAYLGVDGLNPNQAVDPLRVARVRGPHERDRLDQADPARRDRRGGRTMTTMTEPTWLDLPGMPAIAGLRARRFRDAGDYERMADVIRAANLHDDIPWMPTAGNLEVEIDGPATASTRPRTSSSSSSTAGPSRRRRSGASRAADQLVFESWARRSRRPRSWHRLGAARRRTSAVPASAPRSSGRDAAIASARSPTRARSPHRALLERRGFVLDPPLLPDAPAGPRVRPGPAAAGRPRDPAGDARPAPGDLRRPRPRRSGTTGATASGPTTTSGTTHAPTSSTRACGSVAWDGDQVAGVVQTWIWPEENERLGVSARLARAHQRPAAVAAARARAGDLRRWPCVRLRDAGMDDAMLGVDAENPTGALGLYEGLGFEVVKRGPRRTRPSARAARSADGPSGAPARSATGRRCRAGRPARRTCPPALS